MDFSNILDMITDTISMITASIPNQLFGIDTLYIVSGLVLVIILVWMLMKLKKPKQTRELKDPVAEENTQVEDEISESEEANDDEAETFTEEDGFMPSNIPQEIQVTEGDTPESEIQEEVHEVQDESVSVEETPEPESVPETKAEAAPARKADGVVRKKRESTRNGRKITKADFAEFSGKRILIAEDNLINQKVINGVLNESGIDVVMADDGQFVMEILEKDSDFEIILMDAHMPRMDGFEATRAIRENPAYDHIVVVALSGDTAVDDIRHMTEAGMEEHLEKPLKMDALYDVMSMYYSMDEEEAASSETAVEELEIEVDVNDVACLDYDLGLEICGNDEEMYKELLKEFFIGYKDSSKRMRDALVQKNYKEAQSILIDVKGTASNLGAKQFIMITEKFLEALSKGDTASYSQLFKDYQNYLLALLKSIQAAFKV